MLPTRYVKGCLQSCDDADGCNSAEGMICKMKSSVLQTLLSSLLFVKICTSIITWWLLEKSGSTA